MSDNEQLVETITQQVLLALAGDSGDRCADCVGNCVARCGDKVRAVVAAGAGRVSYGGDGAQVPAELARLIDHTLLKPDATAAQIDKLCDEARQYGFAAVCVNPTWVKRAAQRLRGSGVRVASVVGFPLGASTPEIKAMEARRALRDGAREIDMVINVGALKSGDYELVARDVAGVSDACREVGALNKVIIEAALLSDEEKVVACRIAQRARAHYVKTSTGFGPGGATVFDVALMRETVGPGLGVKAAGGIKSAAEAEQMVRAGATRIGASAGVQMVTGGSSRESY
ncbi:MAG: deoxyribose-phosphate aldolase [Acidobacteria bacterium]|nr:MAG: deoxyribose-phosphate aldolase [Acidobacteriota bacterium]